MKTIKSASKKSALTSCGRLKKGYKFLKGGAVVKVVVPPKKRKRKTTRKKR